MSFKMGISAHALETSRSLSGINGIEIAKEPKGIDGDCVLAVDTRAACCLSWRFGHT